MNAIDSIIQLSKDWDVSRDKMVISYSPMEGLFAWYIHQDKLPGGFQTAEFCISGLTHSRNGWWWRDSIVDDFETGSGFIQDDDDVDMGYDPFVKTFNEFKVFYEILNAATYGKTSSEVNAVGVDYSRIAGSGVSGFSIRADSFTCAINVGVKSNDKYPITYKVLDREFKTLEDAEKFIVFRELSDIVFKEFPHIDVDTRRCLISDMIKNQTEIINHLKGL